MKFSERRSDETRPEIIKIEDELDAMGCDASKVPEYFCYYKNRFMSPGPRCIISGRCANDNCSSSSNGNTYVPIDEDTNVDAIDRIKKYYDYPSFLVWLRNKEK